MNKLRVALIGCGRIAQKHVKVMNHLSDDFEIVAVCDLIEEKAKKIAAETGAKVYTDYRVMLANEKLDVVDIMTWSGNHANIAADCAGLVPNVVVEKPMSLQLADADRLIETCRQTGTRLFVVKQNRYNPPVVALRRALEEGRFGKLILGTVRVRWCRTPEYYKQDKWRGTWALDGGVLTNQASHHIDLLTWIFGPVESVFAKTDTFLSPIETEDTGVVVLKFRSGALGIVEATTCARPKDLEGSLSVLGEKGTVEIGGFAVNEMKTWNFSEPRPYDAEVMNSSTNPPDVYGFGHFEFFKAVLKAIREDLPAPIDGLEGRRSLEIINAIYESVELRREVTISFNPVRSRLGKNVSDIQV